MELSASGGSALEGADNEGFTQDWFDEDFGLSSTRREAEELRLQQLQIEQEVIIPFKIIKVYFPILLVTFLLNCKLNVKLCYVCHSEDIKTFNSGKSILYK